MELVRSCWTWGLSRPRLWQNNRLWWKEPGTWCEGWVRAAPGEVRRLTQAAAPQPRSDLPSTVLNSLGVRIRTGRFPISYHHRPNGLGKVLLFPKSIKTDSDGEKARQKPPKPTLISLLPACQAGLRCFTLNNSTSNHHPRGTGGQDLLSCPHTLARCPQGNQYQLQHPQHSLPSELGTCGAVSVGFLHHVWAQCPCEAPAVPWGELQPANNVSIRQILRSHRQS